MLLSVVVVCRLDGLAIDRAAARSLFLGRAAQAILLETIERVDPARAAALHDSAGPRPYSVGALLQPPLAAGEPWRARLRFSALDGGVAEALERGIERLPPALRLDEWLATVETIARDPATDRDAGRASYQDLLNRRLLGPEPPAPRIGLRLLTPTTFHSGGSNQPLPLPGLAFGSLVERWNAFSPLTLNPGARRYAEECLAVAQFRLESRLVEVAGGKQVGAVGRVVYRSLRADPYWLRVIGALADFAFYAGVGAKTTMGLGQARRIDDDGGALRGGARGDPADRRRATDRGEGGRNAGERPGGES